MKRVDGGEGVAFSIVTYKFVTMNTLPMKCCQFSRVVVYLVFVAKLHCFRSVPRSVNIQ